MQQTTNLKTRVGFFLLFGVGVICMLIILFGEIPDLFKPTYCLTVDFPNASGLLKDSNVYLSGALIGKVTSNPQAIRLRHLPPADIQCSRWRYHSSLSRLRWVRYYDKLPNPSSSSLRG